MYMADNMTLRRYNNNNINKNLAPLLTLYIYKDIYTNYNN